jgi:TPR repeat protein
VEWYRKAAEQEVAAAQYSLAAAYVYERGVKKDDKEALKWLSRSAENGDGLAQFALGDRYVKGVGVPVDLVEAFKWLSLAASQDVGDAKKTLDEIRVKMTSSQIADGKRRTQEFVVKGKSQGTAAK